MRDIINKSSFVLVLFVVFVSCNQTNNQSEQQSEISDADKGKITIIEFESKEFDFGTISGGENVSHSFKFKNVGNSNLYITKVTADCGCTVIDFEEDAIAPGKESYIEAVFSSEGYHGLQIKNIKVISNTEPAETELVIAATVEVSEM